MKEIVSDFKNKLLLSDRAGAKKIINKLLVNGKEHDVFEKIIAPAMEQIGNEWENGEISLIQVYMAGRICEFIVNSSKAESSVHLKQPKMAIAVLQDFHTLGKDIVKSIFESFGLYLTDYGGGISVDSLISNIKEDQIEIILVSALMLNSALLVKDLKEKLKVEKLTTKVLVGGAPFRFDRNLWKEVGADFMGITAIDSKNIVINYLEGEYNG